MKKSFLLFLSAGVLAFMLLLPFPLGSFSEEKIGTALPFFSKLAPTPTLSPWLTYVNDHYAYSLNYPRGWGKTEWEFHEATQLSQNRAPQEGMIWQQVKFGGKEKSFQVLIWANRQKVAVPQWLRFYRHEDLDLKKIPQKSNYSILGKEAYLMLSEKTSWGYPVVRIFFLHKDHIFELIAQSPSEALDPIYQETIASFNLMETQ